MHLDVTTRSRSAQYTPLHSYKINGNFPFLIELAFVNLLLQTEQTLATIGADLFIRFSGAFGKRRLELGKLDEELTMPLVGHPTSTVMYFGRVFLGAALCLASPLCLNPCFSAFARISLCLLFHPNHHATSLLEKRGMRHAITTQ